MKFEITRSSILALLGIVVIMFLAGYGFGNISAKTYKNFTESSTASHELR